MTAGVVLGLDIGGSKTQALRAEDGIIVQEAMAGSANVASVGYDEAGRQLDVILERLGAKDIRAVCAGAAGVDTPAGEAQLRDLLAQRLPNARIRVVHDSQLILAAAGVVDGIAVISGTGSVAWGSPRRPTRSCGRVGLSAGRRGQWVLGTGWHAKRCAGPSRGSTGVSPTDRLGQQLAADCGLQSTEQLLDHFYAQPDRRYWAGRARVLFELADSGDPVSTQIVESAAASLTELAVAVAGQAGLIRPRCARRRPRRAPARVAEGRASPACRARSQRSPDPHRRPGARRRATSTTTARQRPINRLKPRRNSDLDHRHRHPGPADGRGDRRTAAGMAPTARRGHRRHRCRRRPDR